MVKKKSLKVDDLLTSNKEHEKIIPFKVNEKATLYYCKKIGYKSIDKLLKELGEAHDYTINTDGVEPMDDIAFYEYFDFLIVKYFTNLEEVLEGADLLTNLKVRDAGYNEGWLIEMFSKIDTEEIEKIFNRYHQLSQIGTEILNIQEREQRKMIDGLKSEHMRKKLGVVSGEESKSIPQS